MTCPKCTHTIPDGLLACASCARQGSDQALRHYQYHPLRTVIAGRGRLIVRQMESGRHVQMFGAEETYCGLYVSPQHKQSRIDYDPEALGRICARCRAKLDEIVNEARRAA